MAVALVSLLASACAARETQERPAAPSNASPASSAASPLPLPDSAFRGDESASRATSELRGPEPSRFDTRRIGASGVSGVSGDDTAGDPSEARHFHGAPVDLDLKSADLANVFRLLADVGHVDIVVSGEITGTVTLRLKHMPWDQALDLVARTRGLELHREGRVILVRAVGPHS